MKFKAMLLMTMLITTPFAYGQGPATAPALPLKLSDSWQFFANVKSPDSFDRIPAELSDTNGNKVSPANIRLNKNTFDIAGATGKVKESSCALFYNEFSSEKAGTMQCGFAADWWMEVYVNGKLILSTMGTGNQAHTFVPDDHITQIPVKSGRNLLAVKVLSGSEGWRFACGAPSNIPNLKFAENSEWKAADMSDVQVKPGTALDMNNIMSFKHLASTGALPRLKIGPTGRLVAEDRPDTPVRLRGYTLSTWDAVFSASKEETSSIIRQSRIQGYNLLRVYDADAMAWKKADMEIDADLLDKMDYLLAQMSENGIYMHLAIFGYNFYMKNPRKQKELVDDNRVLLYLGDAQIRKQWKYGADTLMSHINPYTGRSWRNESAIACVEFFNEQEFGFSHISKLSPAVRTKFDERFRAWLKEKYQTPAALAKAWNLPSISSFDQISIPEKGINDWTPSRKDFILLCNDLARECARWCTATLRQAGYSGLTGQYDLPLWFDDNLVRFETSQVALRHNYFHHPYGPAGKDYWWGSKCDQVSSVSEASGYWRNSNSSRFADRPFFITEYNHPFWNRYQHEAGLLFASYSSFQGFDALVTHDRRKTILKADRPADSFNVDTNPVSRANEVIATYLYLRGDVKTSPHRVELEIPESFIYGSISSEQDKIGLLCGFSISYPWTNPVQGVATAARPDIRLSPSGGAIVQAAQWSAEVVDVKDSKFNLDSFVATMKKANILPSSNISIPSQGIFQSDTGEITMRTKENMLKVATALTEGVTIEDGRSETVDCLKVISTSTPACVAVCSVDGLPLLKSRRILLVYSTETANSGMELSYDRVTLINLGTPPVLLKLGRLNAALRNTNAASMSLYPLAFDGSRREKLPLQFSNGQIVVSLDTATLKNGPTVFFELCAD